MTKFYKGIAGKRNGKAKGAVLHNDAGSKNATAAFYRNWLPNHNAELGFAHVYIGSDGRYQPEDYGNRAWHTANADGNANYVGWEICQSMGDEKVFLENEQKVFADVAKWMKSEGLQPNRNTIRLHQEFSATSCPHRSWVLHGRSLNAVKDYYIAQVLKAMKGNVPAPEQPANTPTTKKFGVGDSVKVVDSLYLDSYGKGRSTAKRGQVGKIKSTAGKGGKKYLVENWGWAHQNDISLVAATNKPNATVNKPTASAVPENRWISKKGTAKITTPSGIRLRLDSTKDTTNPIALSPFLLKRGETVVYDKILVQKNGHVWVRQSRNGGKRFGWLPVAETKNGKVSGSYWVSGVSI